MAPMPQRLRTLLDSPQARRVVDQGRRLTDPATRQRVREAAERGRRRWDESGAPQRIRSGVDAGRRMLADPATRQRVRAMGDQTRQQARATGERARRWWHDSGAQQRAGDLARRLLGLIRRR